MNQITLFASATSGGLSPVRALLLAGVAFTATLAVAAGPVLAADVTTYTYDEARTGAFNVGRLTSVTEGGVTIRMDYDANGNIIRKTWEIAGQTYQHTFSYAQNGQVIQKTFAQTANPNPGGGGSNPGGGGQPGTGAPEVIRGTTGNDIINGTSGDDVIDGLGGRDLIDGGAGIDTLRVPSSSSRDFAVYDDWDEGGVKATGQTFLVGPSCSCSLKNIEKVDFVGDGRGAINIGEFKVNGFKKNSGRNNEDVYGTTGDDFLYPPTVDYRFFFSFGGRDIVFGSKGAWLILPHKDGYYNFYESPNSDNVAIYSRHDRSSVEWVVYRNVVNVQFENMGKNPPGDK